MQKPVTFESSIEQSGQLIAGLEENTISAEEFHKAATDLVSSISGARGFFVALLTGEFQFGDEVPESAIRACEARSEITEELLTKNLIMSTCMEVEHGRKGAEENRTGSIRVQRRSIYMINKIKSETLKAHLLDAKTAIDSKLSGSVQAENTFSTFFSRWPYDEEQLNAARNVITSLLSTSFGVTN